MESPPSSSSWSPQPLILSDDSGLLLTTGSFSSANTSFERKHNIFEDSDCEEKSLSQDESLDGMSDIICGQNFNTLKKGPNWTEVKQQTIIYSPIEPPLEFQDQPDDLESSFTAPSIVDFFCDRLTHQILKRVMLDFRDRCFGSRSNRSDNFQQEKHPISPPPLPSRSIIMHHQHEPPIHRPLAELARFISSSPSHRSHSISYPSPTANFPFLSSHHTPRPSSRSSLGGASSRLSSSHNSLCVASTRKVDDSSFITQAVSHDTLSSNQISDLYNVPFDSDVYAVPVDVVKTKPKKSAVYSCHLLNKKRRNDTKQRSGRKSTTRSEQPNWSYHQCETKRHSVAGTSANNTTEPIHMTLKEVRTYLQTLYSSSSDSSETKEMCNNNNKRKELDIFVSHNNNNKFQSSKDVRNNQILTRPKKSTFLINIKNKKVKDSCGDNNAHHSVTISPVKTTKETKKRRIFNFKQTLCNIFRFRRFLSMEQDKTEKNETDLKMQYELNNKSNNDELLNNSLSSRALPPLPNKVEENNVEPVDFATSIQRVKDYGWYWGPLSSESAEKILSNEPDGSFIVRDSSDDHYIFSLTFKLNNSVRHVRIEHFQGNFSFGSCTKFKSQTIVEFIENAVEHSRSGRYLFFLHRRPVIGPVRVQLLHPISRFKQVQSLQHMCRFIIHKNVRRDLIPQLPLPRRMIDYINTPHYYSERFFDLLPPETMNNNANNNNDQTSSDEGSLRRSFVPPMIFPNENNRPSANEYIVLNSHINQENVNSNDDGLN